MSDCSLKYCDRNQAFTPNVFCIMVIAQEHTAYKNLCVFSGQKFQHSEFNDQIVVLVINSGSKVSLLSTH